MENRLKYIFIRRDEYKDLLNKIDMLETMILDASNRSHRLVESMRSFETELEETQFQFNKTLCRMEERLLEMKFDYKLHNLYLQLKLKDETNRK
jgi:hypothetical protein